MPVETVKTDPVSEERFYEIDYEVMRLVFETHNGLGRFYDEDIYRDELARLCRQAGFDAEVEVPVKVVYGDFFKTYYLDLLINRSVVYELKAVKGFDGAHRRQLLNYLFLCRLYYGKLINFRSRRVEHEFVSTTLDEPQRHMFALKTDDWRGTDCDSSRLKNILEGLIDDWGVFLEAGLYADAVTHFFGGADIVEKMVEIRRSGELIGRQKFRMLNGQTAFFITSISHVVEYRTHLKSLIRNTGIQSVQWVNFDKHNVEFVTVM